MAGSLVGFRSLSRLAPGDIKFHHVNSIPDKFVWSDHTDGSVTVAATALANGGLYMEDKLSGSADLGYRIESTDTATKDISTLFTEVGRYTSASKTDAADAHAYAYANGFERSSAESRDSSPAVSGPDVTVTRRSRFLTVGSSNVGGYYNVSVPTTSMEAAAFASYQDAGSGGKQGGDANRGGGPVTPAPGYPNVARANATASSKVYIGSAQGRPGGTPRVGHTGSALRRDTSFLVTRGDGVPEPINVCYKINDGTIVFDGLGFPDTTLTIRLVQAGFLQQTMQRTVVNKRMTMAGNPSVEAPPVIELVFGDANGDNAINQADVSIINGYVGKTAKDKSWWDVVPNSQLLGGEIHIRVKDLDENQDGQITATDVNVALANVGRTL